MCGKRYNWIEIKNAYESGLSRNQVKLQFGISKSAWSSALKNKKITLKPEDEHFHKYNVRPTDEILVEDSPHKDTTSLKKRLIKEGLLENRCSVCGINDKWNGNPLVLHLDHINGKNNDNRLHNLRMLCPNCHSQTGTYCGRNKSVV